MTVQLWFPLLVLAAWRTWVLLAEDTILDGPRDRLLAALDGKWELFLTCPYCAGFWISATWTAFWWAWIDWSWWLYPLATFAVSAGLVLVEHVKDALSDDE